jgi:hypothetical protein
MKKIITAFAVTAICTTAAKAQVFYAQGGVNFANISTNNNGSTDDTKTLTTFNAGLLGKFGLSKPVDLETGILLQGRGAKAESRIDDNNYVKAKFNPLYLEVPLNVVVKLPFTGSTGVFVSAGPYAAIGIGGKSKVESRFLGVQSNTSETIKFSNDDPTTNGQEGASFDRLKRFDYGINFGAGLEFKHLILKAGYGLGLAKINSTETNNSDNDKNKYRTLSVSVGIPLSR